MVLHQDNKALCRRRSQLSSYMTSGDVRFDNESYTLDIKIKDIFDVSISITLHCRDCDGANRVLGKVNCGSLAYATGDGSQCWLNMVNEPNKNIHQWLSVFG